MLREGRGGEGRGGGGGGGGGGGRGGGVLSVRIYDLDELYREEENLLGESARSYKTSYKKWEEERSRRRRKWWRSGKRRNLM
eukprot:751805-Hanusia_phi.AAC.1